MSKQVAIDSSVLVALVDRQDKWHDQARALHAALKAEGANDALSPIDLYQALLRWLKLLGTGER
jgi:predicted nucleic acid-binding protein